MSTQHFQQMRDPDASMMFDQDRTAFMPMRLCVPEPTIGNKIYCIRERGLWVLEEGPVLLQAVACTHAGSGGLIIYDGVPDDEGFFPEPPAQNQFDTVDEYHQALNTYRCSANGRVISYVMPSLLGMWMYQGSCQHGLTILSRGEHPSSAPVLTVTWMKIKAKK